MASGIVETSSTQEQPRGGQSPGTSRSKLVQRLLGSATNLPQFLNDLLGTMAVVVAGTEAAGFLIEREGEQLGLRPIAHIRPDESDADTRAAAIKAFTEILQPCVVQGKDGAIEVGTPDDGEPQFCLVTLLRSEGQVVAVAAVVTRCLDQERAKQRLQSMQLVAGYFELFTLKRNAEQLKTIAHNHQNVLQLAAAIGSAEGFESAAMNLCNELASRTGATRVALGWRKGEYIKAKALSHTEKFDKKQELIVQIEKAMEECADQEEPVRFDRDGERSENVTRDAEYLSRMQGGNSVLSLPLRRKEGVEGVVTLEFAPPFKLNQPMVDALVVACDVLAAQIYDRHENSRNIVVKVGHSIRHGAGVVVGPKHMVAKLVILLVVAAGLFVSLFKPMYHVSATCQLAASEKRTVSVPWDGAIKEIAVNPRTGEKFKAGDTVQADEVLVVMRTEELQNKMFKAESDANGYRQTYLARSAEAAKDPKRMADAQIAKYQELGARAEKDLYAFQIAQASIKAPEAGVLLKGDFDDKKGATMKVGDPLFEIGKAGELRGEMAVEERDIQDVHVGSKLAYSANSFAGLNFTGKVTRIVPASEPKDGENTFKVYFDLETKDATWMRPGMAGAARVDVEPRRLVWTWTHRLVDFLRLKLWM